VAETSARKDGSDTWITGTLLADSGRTRTI
jgi:hypothetical protein